MAKFKKCFERFEGRYREIPYSRLFVDGKRSPEYAGRYFLPLDGYLMEVPQQDYVDFYRDTRHQKYIREESSLYGEISYSSIGDDELNGEELITALFFHRKSEREPPEQGISPVRAEQSPAPTHNVQICLCKSAFHNFLYIEITEKRTVNK